MTSLQSIGAIVIGRNEGSRLVRCLASLSHDISHVVYVDSGSSDDSIAAAESTGAQVISLDMAVPFTAARARNEGFTALMAHGPVDFVQFVDGDCELDPAWILSAATFLTTNPEVAVAAGRLRERFPDASVYNRLCDQEWDTPIGQARSCGGIAMMRSTAFLQMKGFNSTLIAGEEPELCVRLRAKGWKLWRLDCEMALHDAAMTRFSQWWKRCKRGGYAAAEGATMHGAPPERLGVDRTRRALLWGCILPLIILGLTLITPWALLLAGIYPLQILRLVRREGMHSRANWEHAFFLTLAKFPKALGAIGYYTHRILKRPTTIIEYK